jgi:hypothetical protein
MKPRMSYDYTLQKNVKGKPYITVSAKGISNGLSDIPNDGADFGPDTPGTQTMGIQEAINYAMNNDYHKIFLKNGQYIISAPPTPDPNSSSNYAQIHIPEPQMSNWGELFIEGETGPPFDYSYQGNGTTNNLLYSGPTPSTGVQLLSTLTLSNISTTGTTSVLYVDIGTYGSSSNSALTLHCENIRITIPTGLTITAFNTYNASRIIFKNCTADVNMTQSNYPPNPANAQGNTANIQYDFTGFLIPGAIDGGMMEEIYVVGYYTGIRGFMFHTWLNRIYIQSCYYGISWTNADDHINLLGYILIQQTPYQFVNLSNGHIPVAIMALDAEEDFNLPSTNPYSWANQQYNFYNAQSSGSFSGIVYYHKQGLNRPNDNLITNNSQRWNGLIGICLDGPTFLGNVYPVSTTANGTTAGTVNIYAVQYTPSYIKYIISFSDYENNTTTNQTINYPSPFFTNAVITANNTGLAVSTTLSAITITSPNSTTTYSGIVIVEGN